MPPLPLRASAQHVHPSTRRTFRFKHGGAPAPGSTTAGSVSDTKDIARNVERAEHLDDPVQRKIYEAEVTKASHAAPAA